MHEYGWTIEYTLHEVTMAIAFALYAAISSRYGVDPSGPTYTEKQILDALRKVRKGAAAPPLTA